jgi:hypothetical protein
MIFVPKNEFLGGSTSDFGFRTKSLKTQFQFRFQKSDLVLVQFLQIGIETKGQWF